MAPPRGGAVLFFQDLVYHRHDHGLLRHHTRTRRHRPTVNTLRLLRVAISFQLNPLLSHGSPNMSIYRPLAEFRPIRECTHTWPEHTGFVLSVVAPRIDLHAQESKRQ